ncbi:MAG: AbrB family transcriptional regulator, partial [Alphaproteobacteria bacterium]
AAPSVTPPAPPGGPSRPYWPRILLTLAIGAAGGAAFDYLRVPLAWMIGAMVFCTVASLSGVPVYMSQKIRFPMIAVLGVMLGSAFTPAIVGRVGEWGPTVAGLALYVVLVTAILYYYFRKLCGHDVVTSYFAASPGGLNEMQIVSHALGGDDRVVSLVHASRILLVVLTIPLGFMIFEGYQSGQRGALGPSILSIPLKDWAAMAAIAVVGSALGKYLRLPAGALTGTMLLSGIVHVMGWSDSKPPAELIAAAQIVIGSAVGARFAGVALKKIVRVLGESVGATVIMLGITLGLAWGLQPYAGTSFEALILAYAPGGFAEMSLIALALGIDAAFVSAHHILRIVMLVIVAPPTFRYFWRKRQRRANAQAAERSKP